MSTGNTRRELSNGSPVALARRSQAQPRMKIGTPTTIGVVQSPQQMAIHPMIASLLQILSLVDRACPTRISPRRPSSIATPTEARKQFPHQRALALGGNWQYHSQQNTVYLHKHRPAKADAVRWRMISDFVTLGLKTLRTAKTPIGWVSD